MALARQQDEFHQIAQGIDPHADLRAWAIPASDRRLGCESPFSPGAVLMEPYDGAVDQHVLEVGSG